MKLLLDTHVFVWLADGNRKIGSHVMRRLEDPRNERFLSHTSVWELAIKIGLGQQRIGIPLDDYLRRGLEAGIISLLPISYEHVLAVANLAQFHRDPFDRMLIAQAMHEGMTIVTADDAFDDYPVKRLW